MQGYYLGIDMGSVSTNLVLIDEDKTVQHKLYLRSNGRPVDSLKEGFQQLREKAGAYAVKGAGVTGSGRSLIGALIGADSVKNEITAHAVAAATYRRDVRTILEIGGQDSKLIWMRDGMVEDFAMNTVCAAGTGSFLDRQAARLGISIEELGRLAMQSKNPERIAGRCAVFAESDMIHKQQEGCRREDILRGLCQALVRGFIANLAGRRQLSGPILFQGGVAANPGIKAAFEEELEVPVEVPIHYDVMGAWGAAILAQEVIQQTGGKTRFHEDKLSVEGALTMTECSGCANRCQLVQDESGKAWGSRCGKY